MLTLLFSLLCLELLLVQAVYDALHTTLLLVLSVAITIAVAITITVTLVDIDIVNHNGKVVETMFLIHVFEVGQEIAILHSGTQHKDGDV